MRRFMGNRLQTGKDLEFVRFLHLDNLDRKRLLEEFVIVRRVERLEEVIQSLRSKNSQRFGPILHCIGMPRSGEKRSKSTNMIEVEMRYPDGVEIRPVESVLSHSPDR